MKLQRNEVTALVAALLAAISIGCLVMGLFVQSHMYSQTAEVVQLDRDADMVYLETSAGHLYVMYGCEDWMLGDLASATFFDAFTSNVTDDIIFNVRWSGWNLA